MLIQSAEEVNELIRGNRLRNFTSATQGRDRLFPFARPQTTLSRPLPADPSFFIAGNCFARGMEKTLRQVMGWMPPSPTASQCAKLWVLQPKQMEGGIHERS